jgi:hypothetical protein
MASEDARAPGGVTLGVDADSAGGDARAPMDFGEKVMT